MDRGAWWATIHRAAQNRTQQKRHGGGFVAKSYRTLATPWTVAYQAPLSMGFSRQEYWSGLPCSPPGDLLDPGIEPSLLHCRQILY